MEDLLPFYIYNGVSKAEFMDSEPRELECYDLAYKFSEGRKNFHEHMQGVYTVEGIRITHYPEKTYYRVGETFDPTDRDLFITH